MSDFLKGDVVQLRSGGPKMTVAIPSVEYRKRKWTYCHWFGDAELKRAWFAPESLVLVSDDPGKQHAP